MRKNVVRSAVTTLALLVLTAGPALAQEAGSGSARPWHYWIAPFLLGGGILAIAAIGLGYYVRVMGGPRRR